MHNLPNILSLIRLISPVLVFLLVLINQPWAFLGANLLFLFPPMLTFNSPTLVFSEVLLLVADLLVLLATIWTIFSGIEYMIGALPLFQSGEATGKTQ